MKKPPFPTDKTVLMVAESLLRMRREGELRAVWCDAGRFRVERNEWDGPDALTWTQAYNMATKKRPANKPRGDG